MKKRQRYFIYVLALAFALSFGHATARAKDPEFDAITKHLKAQYKAKRRKIPFMGLANFAVKIIRPAGIKSVKVAIFEELNHAPAAGNNELSAVMRNALRNGCRSSVFALATASSCMPTPETQARA